MLTGRRKAEKEISRAYEKQASLLTEARDLNSGEFYMGTCARLSRIYERNAPLMKMGDISDNSQAQSSSSASLPTTCANVQNIIKRKPARFRVY